MSEFRRDPVLGTGVHVDGAREVVDPWGARTRALGARNDVDDVVPEDVVTRLRAVER